MTVRSERVVSVQCDGVRSPVATARLTELSVRVLGALRVKHAMVSITLVSARAMATLNRTHLGHPRSDGRDHLRAWPSRG